MTTKKNWKVYFVRCSDTSLYCGITNNLKKRVQEHNFSSRGSKYTRARRPVKLVWHIDVASRSEALKIELRLKKIKKEDKEKLIEYDYHYDNDIINNILSSIN